MTAWANSCSPMPLAFSSSTSKRANWWKREQAFKDWARERKSILSKMKRRISLGSERIEAMAMDSRNGLKRGESQGNLSQLETKIRTEKPNEAKNRRKTLTRKYEMVKSKWNATQKWKWRWKRWENGSEVKTEAKIRMRMTFPIVCSSFIPKIHGLTFMLRVSAEIEKEAYTKSRKQKDERLWTFERGVHLGTTSRAQADLPLLLKRQEWKR